MYRWRRTCAAAEPPSWLSCFHRLHKHMPGWTIQPFVSPMAFSSFEKAFDWLPVVNLSSIISSFIKSEDGSSYVHLLLPHCVLCMKNEYSNVLSWECLPKCASSSSSKADDPHRHQTKFSHASFFFWLNSKWNSRHIQVKKGCGSDASWTLTTDPSRTGVCTEEGELGVKIMGTWTTQVTEGRAYSKVGEAGDLRTLQKSHRQGALCS